MSAPIRLTQQRWPADTRPVVSICCTAYQHADFITSAIQGFLMQETTFPVEILIGEDESMDGTREICQRYAQEYPHLIRLLYGSRKDVIYFNGRPSGRRNLLRVLEGATGRYVAMCDGDDHWIDPLKLQRQVDAMEADPSAAGCYANAYNEEAGVRTPYHGGEVRVPQGDRLNMSSYIRGEGVPTCTFLFRRTMLKDITHFSDGFPSGDTALFTSLLLEGHFIYHPRFVGVRVKHPGGVYSMQMGRLRLLFALQNRAQQDKLTGGRYKDILQARMHNNLRDAWRTALVQNDMELGKLAWSHLAKVRAVMGWSRSDVVWNGLRVHLPVLYNGLERVRWRLKGLVSGLRSGHRR